MPYVRVGPRGIRAGFGLGSFVGGFSYLFFWTVVAACVVLAVALALAIALIVVPATLLVQALRKEPLSLPTSRLFRAQNPRPRPPHGHPTTNKSRSTLSPGGRRKPLGSRPMPAFEVRATRCERCFARPQDCTCPIEVADPNHVTWRRRADRKWEFLGKDGTWHLGYGPHHPNAFTPRRREPGQARYSDRR